MDIDTEAILSELTSENGSLEAAARTMVLVAYVDDPAIVTWMHERMRAILEKRPSRLVLLDATRDIHSHETERIADAEWILLGTRGLAPDALRSIVHGFTISGVPTVLLWAGERLVKDANFLALNETADSLILDSSRVARAGVEALRELIAYFAHDQRYAVQDMAYLRLAPWQEMIANFFDERDLIEDLFAINRVEITAGSLAEPYYLLGWLAGSLEWKPCGPHEFCNRFGTTITCDVKQQGEPRRIYDVVLHSQNNIFKAELQDDGLTVCLTIEGTKTHPQHCEPLHDVDVIALLDHAILDPRTPEIYRTTLTMAGEILDRRSNT